MTIILRILLIALPSLICALSDTQIPFHIPADNIMMAHGTKATFRFKEGSDVFSPKDLVELSRPGPGLANVPGDLILVPVSKYSFADKKYVRASSFLTRFISHTCVPVRDPARCSRTTVIFGRRIRGSVSKTRSLPMLPDVDRSDTLAIV